MTRDIFNIKGRIVVITGGLGQLGRQYCNALVERGAKVAIIDLPKNPQRMVEEFKEGDNLIYIPADVAEKKSLEKALREITDRWGTPYALINNAALDSPPGASVKENGPFESYPEESWDKVIDVNVKGVFLTCQVIGGAMAEKNRGSIVNISSIYGILSPNQNIYKYREKQGKSFFKPVAYSASKSAIVNLTRYLATYWAKKGVRVNTLTLGGVFNNQDDDFLRGYCEKVPMGRMANEDEYNGAIVFLVSDGSVYMTGSNLIIDGGWSAW